MGSLSKRHPGAFGSKRFVPWTGVRQAPDGTLERIGGICAVVRPARFYRKPKWRRPSVKRVARRQLVKAPTAIPKDKTPRRGFVARMRGLFQRRGE